MSSFSFGAFPNRLDQQLMVEIASLLLMAVETDAAMQNKEKQEKKRKRSLAEQQKCVQLYSHGVEVIPTCPFTFSNSSIVHSNSMKHYIITEIQ